MRWSSLRLGSRSRKLLLAVGSALVSMLSLPVAAPAQGPARLVRDIGTGASPGASRPFFIREAGDFAYFFASTPPTGQELWRTDGTEAGTILVKDILPGSRSGIVGSPGEDVAPVVIDGI